MELHTMYDMAYYTYYVARVMCSTSYRRMHTLAASLVVVSYDS